MFLRINICLLSSINQFLLLLFISLILRYVCHLTIIPDNSDLAYCMAPEEDASIPIESELNRLKESNASLLEKNTALSTDNLLLKGRVTRFEQLRSNTLLSDSLSRNEIANIRAENFLVARENTVLKEHNLFLHKELLEKNTQLDVERAEKEHWKNMHDHVVRQLTSPVQGYWEIITAQNVLIDDLVRKSQELERSVERLSQK